MRLLLALAAILAIFACAPRAVAPPSGCDHIGSAEVAFTGAGADTVETRTFGPSCKHAVGVIAVRAPDGAAIWAWSAPLYPTFGGLFAPSAGADVSPEIVAAFTARWADLTPLKTSNAPAWLETEAAPMGGATPGVERTVYEDIRARDLPMICHLSGVAMETCVYWEPAAATAVRLVDRPVSATAR